MPEASVNKVPEVSTQVRCHCNRTFKDASAMAQHRRDTKHHPPENPTPIPGTLVRCSCGRGFKSEKALQQHKIMSPRHPIEASLSRTDTKAPSSRENSKDSDDVKWFPIETRATIANAMNLLGDKDHGNDDTVPKDAKSLRWRIQVLTEAV